MDDKKVEEIELLLEENQKKKKETYSLIIDVSISDLSIAKKIMGTLLEYKDYIEDVYETTIKKEET